MLPESLFEDSVIEEQQQMCWPRALCGNTAGQKFKTCAAFLTRSRCGHRVLQLARKVGRAVVVAESEQTYLALNTREGMPRALHKQAVFEQA